MLQTVPQIGKFRIIHQEKRGHLRRLQQSDRERDAALGIWVHKGVINRKAL